MLFRSSFDWHSCVHGWWTLLTLRRLYPDSSLSLAIDVLADETFTEEKIKAELAYLDRPSSRGFERPYGWAWLLYLHLEMSRHDDRDLDRLLEPLARAFAHRLHDYLEILWYPIRTGTHFNSAFALTLSLEWADRFDCVLAKAIRDWAISAYLNDRDCQAWEPGGDEFLSPALCEALCMKQVFAQESFEHWFAEFLPRLADSSPHSLISPALVSDRSDGKIAHLDGLNLSRAWCWRSIAPALPPAERAIALAAADDHLATALPHIAGDYMGEHWLASFALLALTA